MAEGCDGFLGAFELCCGGEVVDWVGVHVVEEGLEGEAEHEDLGGAGGEAIVKGTTE